jgi:glycosyltransferase involved in cell wall biosynthesis
MRELRIAVITPHPPSLGTLNEYGYHFVRHLRAKSEVKEVIALVDELPEGQSYKREPKLRFVPCWRFNALNNIVRIMRVLRDEKPDAVLFNIQFATFGRGKLPATLGLFAPALVKLSGVPSVVLLHNIMETVDLKRAGFGGNPLMEKVIRFFGNIVTRVLLQADLVALTIPKYVEIIESKFRAKNVLLTPHGAFDDVTDMPSLDAPPGPLQIMTFGKFGTYKRIEVLVEAFRMLQQDGTQRPLELVIAGTDSPNAQGYLAGVQAQYADVPNIRMTGYVAEEDVPRVFGDSSVVVFPYNSTTGSSGVLHQAGNYGRSVVLPNLGDLKELIEEEGYAGEYFTPEDARSLADAIARVIDNPERRRELGKRNYLASQGLPLNDVVDWYLIHIEELLKRRGPSNLVAAGKGA